MGRARAQRSDPPRRQRRIDRHEAVLRHAQSDLAPAVPGRPRIADQGRDRDEQEALSIATENFPLLSIENFSL